MTQVQIRALGQASTDEVELIAARMRATLQEVLGPEAGEALYTMEWLRERVRFHLEAARDRAAVLVAEDATGAIIGHAIVREERDELARAFGLMSTIYVLPASRRAGVADRLVDEVEAWIHARGLARAATNTGSQNHPLIRLFENRGYAIRVRTRDMVQLSRRLAPGSAAR